MSLKDGKLNGIFVGVRTPRGDGCQPADSGAIENKLDLLGGTAGLLTLKKVMDCAYCYPPSAA